ncbi:phospholipase D-like protein [Salana multivorans]|uniref:Phospholipase D-like protein n=1 Tax=Salana multivorans TaxID=120377 RepID=A0A3N2D7V9_9MICO|nr:PLDc N-terminal domain-containing protein [Salana multivorans]MBN8883539.1 PLDc_N domain-containing protein [Salana multivorans]OJX93997.1 MAG: hypothetical protein BGO96_09240 [Micrococcales bacterium 73-15]ROR95861.1 phospholipase D-like protein [Salana multivorans]
MARKQRPHESPHERWEDLGRGKRRAIVVLGAVQVSLTAWAAYDLWHRPAEQVKGGHKLPWALSLAVNWVGPITYLAAGRVKP